MTKNLHHDDEERPVEDRLVDLAENDTDLSDDIFDSHSKLAEQGHIDNP